jgi:hypothetical protein
MLKVDERRRRRRGVASRETIERLRAWNVSGNPRHYRVVFPTVALESGGTGHA